MTRFSAAVMVAVSVTMLAAGATRADTGPRWTIQPTPSLGPAGSRGLSGVSCASPRTCVATRGGYLRGVSCTTASACTAVGYYDNQGNSLQVAESWDGSTWLVTAAPSLASSDLWSVSCVSSTVCTAVGDQYSQSGLLAERWNGTSWVVQRTSNPTGSQGGRLEGVSCVSTSDCIAVGWYQDSSAVTVTLAETWDGSRWTARSTPNPTGGGGFYGIACLSGSLCTAVGFNGTGSTLAERYR